MQVTEQEERILAETMRMLGSGVTANENLEDFLISFNVLGRLVSVQQGECELLEQQRKVEWARAFTQAKLESKISDKVGESIADISVDSLRKKEIRAREKLTLLKNTLESIREAIWAIKYLGKMTG
jgi:hypothetical protein